MRPFGICMAGCEERFEGLLREAVARYTGSLFVYLEIGVAYGGTWKAVHDILTNACGKRMIQFAMVGVEPNITPELEQLKLLDNTVVLPFTREHVADQGWLRVLPPCFVLIDGCHSRKCAMEDFLAVEPLVVPGGIVIFHDFGVESIGAGVSPHCSPEPMDVRGAAVELGLLEPCTRPGWEFVGEWEGDRSRDGFGCGVYRKTSTTGEKL